MYGPLSLRLASTPRTKARKPIGALEYSGPGKPEDNFSNVLLAPKNDLSEFMTAMSVIMMLQGDAGRRAMVQDRGSREDWGRRALWGD